MIHSHKNYIDLPILIGVLALMVLSLGVVYSASSTWAQEKFGESDHLLGSHAVKVLAGFLAILVGMSIDYRRYRKLTKPALVIAILFLVATFALGGEVKGAARWFRLGGFGLQPSELAKFVLVFHLCTLIAQKQEKVREFKTGFLPLILWVGAVTGLVLVQPNFSTGAMIFLISMVMLYVGRARILHIALTLLGLVPLLGVYMMSADYRMRRIMNFLGGGQTGDGNYQLWQGIIGFGNGGIIGVGPGESRQRDFFLPESYGDFVFSIVGEEYGLLGTMFILLVFVTIMLRGMRVARYARDEYGRYLAIGITTTVALYALVNAGVTLGLLPTTGLPMPFVSYGGSSMVFTAFAVGVLLNISAHTDLHPRLAENPGATRQVESAVTAGKVY